MARRKKQKVVFTAELPAKICDDKKYKVVSRKLWETLTPADREDYYTVRGPKSYRVRIYRQVFHVPPYANPALEAVRKKLNRYRVPFIELAFEKYGREFIRITTEGVANG